MNICRLVRSVSNGNYVQLAIDGTVVHTGVFSATTNTVTLNSPVSGRKVTYTTLNQEHISGQTATWSEVGEISVKVDGTDATGSVVITDDDTTVWSYRYCY